MWITDEQWEETVVRFKTMLILAVGVGFLFGGFTVYGVADTETDNDPGRMICKVCDDGEMGWIYCKPDTEGVTQVSTPDYCEVKEGYVQLDRMDDGRLRGTMSRQANLEIQVDNLTAEMLKDGCTLHLYGETVRCDE